MKTTWCIYIFLLFEQSEFLIATCKKKKTDQGVAAVSCMESHMNRRPLGSIDPNSIRERASHRVQTQTGEGVLYSPQHDRDRDAARQRAAATRRLETDEARAERLRANRQRKATRRQQETKPHGHHFAGVQRKDYVLLRLGSPQGMPTERGE